MDFSATHKIFKMQAKGRPRSAGVGVVPLQGGPCVEGLALERVVKGRRVHGQALEGVAALPVVLLQGGSSHQGEDWGRCSRQGSTAQQGRAMTEDVVGVFMALQEPAHHPPRCVSTCHHVL